MSNESLGAREQGTLGSYLTGFIAALVLTGRPFFFVMSSVLPRTAAIIVITIFALAQITVHLAFFLHLGRPSAEQRWNLAAFAYILVTLAIFVGGSIWVMYYLNASHMGMGH